jgi:hypothetical protein
MDSGALTRDAVTAPLYAKRQFSLVQLQTQLVTGGYVENPDEVLKQFGSYEGIQFYLRMLRQFPFLASPVSQRIDPVIATERQIIPGDVSVDVSVRMANDLRRVFDDLKNKETIQRKALMGQFIGIGPIEKVWGIHKPTGLLAPVGENGDGNGLFDVPVRNVKFGPHGEELIVTPRNYAGVPVPRRKLMIFRWGSLATDYGEGEFKGIYLATWYMQIILDYGMKALELLGRPIPVVHIPRNSPDPDEADKVEKSVASQFDFYMTLPTDESKASVEMAGGNVAASGTAGRAEQEWSRYIENWIWTALINTSQTQDRGGAGNGKLEHERRDLKIDKVTAASDALDAWWTDGFANDIAEVNWANQPRELWPRFKSDITEVTQDGLSGPQVEQADLQLRRLAANQITSEQAEELITGLGIPRSRVLRMVQATISKRHTLTASDLTNTPKAATPPSEAQQEAA